jgi:tyrosyl-tRNA synthetase
MQNNSLSDELAWRGFVNQTTYKDPRALDAEPITFYLGVDPSADSMTIGNLVPIMMVRHFIEHGHKAVLLIGGATGLIGDPDGKAQERDLKTPEQIEKNKQAIVAEYRRLLNGYEFTVVDNYDWFKGFGYIEFLREVGKHVPMRTMLNREFVQNRLGDDGAGISYAEFSYSLIQGYDFVHLNRELGVSLQICGADQWGNSIAGVDLVRRINGQEAHVWSMPLVVNKTTGVKFGKSEAGAVWLDPAKTTPTDFYQFWINVDDAGVEDYLKLYTTLSADAIADIMRSHAEAPEKRFAQTRLAQEVTTLVHGQDLARAAQEVTAYLVGQKQVGEITDQFVLEALRSEVATATAGANGSITDALDEAGLVSSKSEARRLLAAGAVYVHGVKIDRETFVPDDFQNGKLLLRKGKKYKDTALIELK